MSRRGARERDCSGPSSSRGQPLVHDAAVGGSDREARELGGLEDETEQQVLRPERAVLGVPSGGLDDAS